MRAEARLLLPTRRGPASAWMRKHGEMPATRMATGMASRPGQASTRGVLLLLVLLPSPSPLLLLLLLLLPRRRPGPVSSWTRGAVAPHRLRRPCLLACSWTRAGLAPAAAAAQT